MVSVQDFECNRVVIVFISSAGLNTEESLYVAFGKYGMYYSSLVFIRLFNI